MDARHREFLEQPLPKDDIKGLAQLSRAIPLKIYADESVLDVHGVRRLGPGRGHTAPGTAFTSSRGAATVVKLPLDQGSGVR